jgi:uncharacterized protein DUF4282
MASIARRASIDRCNIGVQSAPPAVDSQASNGAILPRGRPMFGIGDLFQWERFITPSIIKVFYWLAVVIAVLLGLAGAFSSLLTMAVNPFVGMISLIASVLGALMAIIIARIFAEFVLIVFRINEHLGAIRNRGQM